MFSAVDQRSCSTLWCKAGLLKHVPNDMGLIHPHRQEVSLKHVRQSIEYLKHFFALKYSTTLKHKICVMVQWFYCNLMFVFLYIYTG